MVLWWKVCPHCRRFTRRGEAVCHRCGKGIEPEAAPPQPRGPDPRKTIVLYGGPPDPYPLVSWLVCARDGEELTVHRLGQRFRIADDPAANLQVPGMAGVCDLTAEPAGYRIVASGGAAMVINGQPVEKFDLVDNDLLEVANLRLCYKSIN